ncbi:MAG: HEAT repeat domain-containing protein [Gemmatimonadota bacterium]
MTRSSAIADSLSRVVFLIRDQPDDREAQKSAFRALLARVSEQPVLIATQNGTLAIDGEAAGPDSPGADALRRQLLSHGIGELGIPSSLTPPQLLTVLRALAAAPGTFPRLQQLADHFTVSGIDGVIIAPPLSAIAPQYTDLAPPSENATTPDPKPIGIGPDAVNEESVGLLHFVTMEMKSIGELDELLLTLEQDPNSPKTGDLLNEVLAFGEITAKKEQWQDLLRAAATLVHVEDQVTEESHRRLYSIAIRRLVGRRVLESFAQLLHVPESRNDATLVMRRMGADSTEVLMQLLIAEQDVGQRRAYFNAVTQMTDGTELLVHMLGHDEWFVVRNVAELCGEMKLEAAVPALARRMTHVDERVRRAATSALGRIGSPGTIEPLRRALQDTSALVRIQAATSLEGPRAKNLVPALARLIEEEAHPEVQREMLHALGRIGTPEATDILIGASRPGKGLFKKKPVALRVEAIEGLRLAGDQGARAALQDLQQDKSEEVSRSAGLALKSLMTARTAQPQS